MQELSAEIRKGLGLFSDPKIFPDVPFKELVESVFGILLGRMEEKEMLKSQNLSKIDKIYLKQAQGALSTFLLEAAKVNADPLILKGILEDEKVRADRIDFITGLFDNRRSALRVLLSTSTFTFPHITGVDWRLDYHLKSNTLEKINEPVYQIALQTKETQEIDSESDGIGSVEFSCNSEQLQDLVTRLKDAVKQVERSALNL